MRCPSCGHTNSDLATRCASCGSALPARAGDTARRQNLTDEKANSQHPSPVDDTAPHPRVPDEAVAYASWQATNVTDQDTPPQTAPVDDTTPRNTPPIQDTAEQPQADAPASSSERTDPQFRQVASTAGQYASAKSKRAVAFFHEHQRVVGLVIALLVVGVLGVVWFTINLLDAPAYTSIEKDVAERIPSYTYAGGTYGPDLEIPLSNVAVTKRTGTRTPDGMDTTEGIGSVAYDVEAEATYDDGKMHVVRNVDTTYVHKGDAWQMTGELADRGLSLTARAGVDEAKVLANLDSILDAASAENDISLTSLYEDGSFSIVGNSFKEAANKDTATNDITIHCAKEGGFFAYEGNVTARFAFESGMWSLRSAKADEHATGRTYTPLVGLWSGELTSTSSNGANCYGAQAHKLEVTIDSVGDSSSGSKVIGTITVLAHYHGKLENKSDSSEGDKLVERVPFTGTIKSERDERTGSNLRLEASTTGTAEGELSFVLEFGTDDDPSEVTARVTTTHTYQEMVLLFIPHQTTSKFVDSYLVSHT